MNDTSYYLRQVRSWWTVIVAIVIAAGITGFLAAHSLQEPEYRASTTVALSDTSDSSGNLEEVRTALELAPAFAELARSPAVLEPVIEELSLSKNARDLRKQVRTSVIDDTSMIQITVTAATKARAADLSTAIGKNLIIVGTGLQPQAPQRDQLQQDLDNLHGQIVAGEQRLGLMVYLYLDKETADGSAASVGRDSLEFRQISAMKIELDAKRDAYQAKRQEIQDLPEAFALSVIEPTGQTGSTGGLRSSILSGIMAAAAGLLIALGGLLLFSQNAAERQGAGLQPQSNQMVAQVNEAPPALSAAEQRRATDAGRWPG